MNGGAVGRETSTACVKTLTPNFDLGIVLVSIENTLIFSISNLSGEVLVQELLLASSLSYVDLDSFREHPSSRYSVASSPFRGERVRCTHRATTRDTSQVPDNGVSINA